jgi:hypothetical protein
MAGRSHSSHPPLLVMTGQLSFTELGHFIFFIQSIFPLHLGSISPSLILFFFRLSISSSKRKRGGLGCHANANANYDVGANLGDDVWDAACVANGNG